MAEAGHDPFKALVAVAVDQETPIEIRVRVNLELMSFIYPKRKPQNEPVDIPLGKSKTLTEISEAQSMIIEFISIGKISPDNGKVLSDVLELKRKSLETVDIENRLRVLEKETKGKGNRF